jgi:hypothetical protein
LLIHKELAFEVSEEVGVVLFGHGVVLPGLKSRVLLMIIFGDK